MGKKEQTSYTSLREFIKEEYGDRGGINDREEAKKAMKQNGASDELIRLVLDDD